MLFLYDSCDKLEIIEKLLPREDEQIHVIITTRQRNGHYFLDHSLHNVLHLDVLETDDAVQTLLSWKGNGQNNCVLDDECKENSSAEILIERPEIGRLPLAIRHAGTYLRETKISCEEYIDLLAKRKEKLQTIGNDMNEILKYNGLQHLADALEKERIANVRDFRKFDLTQLQTSSYIKYHELQQLIRIREKLNTATVMAWDLEIEEIMKNADETSSMILQMASLLDGKLIAKDLLLLIVSDQDGNVSDKNRYLNQSISLLSRFCLVNDDDGFSMHGLVQQSVVEVMMSEGTFSRQLCALCDCLTSLLPESPVEVRRRLNDKQVLDLTSHVYVASYHILRSGQLDDECWLLLQISCWMAIEYEHLIEADHLCQTRLDLVRRVSQQCYMQNVMLFVCKLSKIYAFYWNAVLNIFCIFVALMDLGKVYIKLGNVLEAVSIIKEALELCKRCDTLLNQTYYFQGAYTCTCLS